MIAPPLLFAPQIQVGNIGEIYKIRLAHDNSGDFPGWLCDEVSMKDADTNEELTFSCRRWLARDEDDQEITRELAVKRPGEPILPRRTLFNFIVFIDSNMFYWILL